MTAGVKERISTESARHVEIIHTNAGFLGIFSPVGHVDFYPNGGSVQSGCLTSVKVPVNTCSHFRAYEYLAKSIINETGFYGKKCSKQMDVLRGCDGASLLMGGIKDKIVDKGLFYVSIKDS